MTPATPTLTGPTGSLAGLTPTVTWNAAANRRHIRAVFPEHQHQPGNGPDQAERHVVHAAEQPDGGQLPGLVARLHSDGTAGSWSNGDSFTLLGSLPATPTLTGPTGVITNLTPAITWNAAANASTYELYLLDASTNQGTDLTKLSGTSYTPASSLALGSYQVWVRAFNGAGQASAWSSGESFIVAALAPTGPGGTIATQTPTFTWTSSTAANHYDISLTDATTGQATRYSNLTGTSLTLTAAQALTPGNNYTWTVGMVVAAGQAETWSSGQTFSIPALAAPTASAGRPPCHCTADLHLEQRPGRGPL